MSYGTPSCSNSKKTWKGRTNLNRVTREVKKLLYEYKKLYNNIAASEESNCCLWKATTKSIPPIKTQADQWDRNDAEKAKIFP